MAKKVQHEVLYNNDLSMTSQSSFIEAILPFFSLPCEAHSSSRRFTVIAYRALCISMSLVKWRLTDWIKFTGSNPNSCASLEDSGTRSWRRGSFVPQTHLERLAQQEKCCRTWS